jgi:hypothetical protein
MGAVRRRLVQHCICITSGRPGGGEGGEQRYEHPLATEIQDPRKSPLCP